MGRNPYAAPESLSSPGPAELRLSHRSHEARVVILGWVYATIGLLSLLSLPLVAAVLLESGAKVQDLSLAGVVMLLLGFAVPTLYVVAGAGMAQLSPWARWVGGVAHVLSLLLPGTVAMGIWGLFLHLSGKGRVVFSLEYAQVRAQEAVPWRPTALGVLLVAGHVLVLCFALGVGVVTWLAPAPM